MTLPAKLLICVQVVEYPASEAVMEYEDSKWFGDLRVPYISHTDPVHVAQQNRKDRPTSRAYTDRAKNRPCVDCKIGYPPYVMDFDHVRGEKVANISHMARVRTNIQRLQAEIDKCDVVCANCHRERTHQRGLTQTAKI